MATGERIHATRYDLDKVARSVVFKASVDTDALTSTAILSYPEPDLAGDIVVPEGMDFSWHSADPRVDIEHRRDPAFGDATVGWARTTCKIAGGYYTVRPVNLEVTKGQYRPLPVATTHFDKNNRLEHQVFALVDRDILPAVSVEFIPDMTVAKSLGKSPLEPRDAYQFGRVSVVRYTLCAKGVCPSALVAKSVYNPLASVLSAGRIGSEQLHPTICKALAHHLPGKSTTVTGGYARVEKSDMDPNAQADAPPLEPVDAAPDEAAAQPAINGITALYNHAQALTDLCDQLEQDAESSDSAEVVKDIKKLCEMGRATAEKVMATADKHNDKLEAAKGTGDETESEPATEGEESADDAEPDMDRDDEGNLKAIPLKYATIVKAQRVRVKRFSLADIQKAEAKVEPVPAPVEGDSPEDIALLEKQLRLYDRDKRLYG